MKLKIQCNLMLLILLEVSHTMCALKTLKGSSELSLLLVESPAARAVCDMLGPLL